MARAKPRYRKIESKLWAWPKFRALKPSHRLVLLHILTGPHTTLVPGLWVAGLGSLAESANLPAREYSAAVEQLQQQELVRVDWDHSVVWAPLALEFDPPTSPTQIIGWAPHLAEVQQCELRWAAERELKDWLSARPTLAEAGAQVLRGPDGEDVGLARRESSAEGSEEGIEEGIESQCDPRSRSRDRSRTQEQDNSLVDETSAAARKVFEHWCSTMAKSRAFFDRRRLRTVVARLHDGFSVEQLCKAIDGCRADSWSMGDNDRRTAYNDLSLICRDAAHVEKFMGFADHPPQRPPTRGSPRIMTSAEWVNVPDEIDGCPAPLGVCTPVDSLLGEGGAFHREENDS